MTTIIRRIATALTAATLSLTIGAAPLDAATAAPVQSATTTTATTPAPMISTTPAKAAARKATPCQVVARQMPANAAARGWKVQCMRGPFRFPQDTRTYKSYTDPRAKKIYLAPMSTKATQQAWRYQVRAIPARDLAPVLTPMQQCTRVLNQYRAEMTRLAPGWTARCTTDTLHLDSHQLGRGEYIAGLASPSTRTITVRAIDGADHTGVYMHELGHAIQFGWSPAVMDAWAQAVGADESNYFANSKEIFAESYRNYRTGTHDARYRTMTPETVQAWMTHAATQK